MATTVYEVLELELQDGTVIQVKPLDIKRLRKVMKIIEEMNAAVVDEDKEGEEDEEQTLDYLLKAVAICIQKDAPEISADPDKLEEAMDMVTMWKILEVSAGVSMGNPNLTREAAGLPGLI